MQVAHYRNPSHRPGGARLGQPPHRQDFHAGPMTQDLDKFHLHDELRLCDALYSGGHVRAQKRTASRRRIRESAQCGLLHRDQLRERA